MAGQKDQATDSILTPHQKEVLNAITQERYFTDRYYLTGGTALAEYYLKHRFSEDLDLFNESEEVNPDRIAQFWNSKGPGLDIITVQPKNFLGLYEYFLHFRDETILKVDFNYYPFERIEKKRKVGGLEIDSIYDIAVNKVHTLTMRQKARDYVDIYFIIKEKGYDLWHLILQAKAKFDWDISIIELGARLRNAKDMTDFPRMIKPIDHREWQDFFLQEAAKLKDEIFIP